MITRHLTNVAITFNPFLKSGRTARLFLSLLPPDARQTMKIQTTVLPRENTDGGSVEVVFKDGLKMKLDAAKMSIKDVVDELDRHSRMLGRKDELNS